MTDLPSEIISEKSIAATKLPSVLVCPECGWLFNPDGSWFVPDHTVAPVFGDGLCAGSRLVGMTQREKYERSMRRGR